MVMGGTLAVSAGLLWIVGVARFPSSRSRGNVHSIVVRLGYDFLPKVITPRPTYLPPP